MLYIDVLEKHRQESEEAVRSLFEKVEKNQSNKNDLLLVFLNGFHNENLVGSGLSPFMFGAGSNLEVFTEQTQYDFFHSFRTTYLQESKEESRKRRGDSSKHKEYDTITQLEMMVYLKLWESDLLLKQLYNLCYVLLHSDPYDWYKTTKRLGRKSLIEDKIINSCKGKAPKFYQFIDSVYKRQIRNATAHSQFYILDNHISFTNHDPKEGHALHSMSIDEWEEVFHRTVLFYNSFIGVKKDFFQKYKDEAKDKHYGKKIRIVPLDSNPRYEWVKYLRDTDRWVWYRK